MNSSSAPMQTSKSVKKPFFSDLYKNLLLRRLADIVDGQIHIKMSSEDFILGESVDEQNVTEPLGVRIEVINEEFFSAVVLGGSVGAAESYMQGDWTCSDLTGLVRILLRNSALLDAMEGGLASLASVVMKSAHSLRKNTRSGSRKNIAEHYDLGNDLFELFLDKDWMMYSSGLYRRESDSLEQAQASKLHSLCEKLHLKPTDHLLEIGTGWGGCAIYAASNYGCQVTTTTISQQQYQFALERVQKAGLEDKVTVLLEDYRDLQGHYDKLVSIEMVEAVGHQFVQGYFACCAKLLKQDGIAVIQAITIEDHRYEQALKSVDFIKRYIFPGSFIPSVSVLTNAAGQAQLRLNQLDDIGYSYALTLAEWRKRFMGNLDAVRALGYSEAFIRMWEFYLCYCEGGFIERSISDVHMQFVKPGNRCASQI